MERNEVLEGLLSDGLHFTGEGYRVLYREFMGLVEREMPELRAEALPEVFPAWDDEAAWA